MTIPTLNDCPGGITAPLGFRVLPACIAASRKIKKDIAMIVSECTCGNGSRCFHIEQNASSARSRRQNSAEAIIRLLGDRCEQRQCERLHGRARVE